MCVHVVTHSCIVYRPDRLPNGDKRANHISHTGPHCNLKERTKCMADWVVDNRSHSSFQSHAVNGKDFGPHFDIIMQLKMFVHLHVIPSNLPFLKWLYWQVSSPGKRLKFGSNSCFVSLKKWPPKRKPLSIYLELNDGAFKTSATEIVKCCSKTSTSKGSWDWVFACLNCWAKFEKLANWVFMWGGMLEWWKSNQWQIS